MNGSSDRPGTRPTLDSAFAAVLTMTAPPVETLTGWRDPHRGNVLSMPGERLTPPIIEYLRSGLAAGMGIPDATDPTLKTFRISAESGT